MKMVITGLQANLLLFGLDKLLGVDGDGKLLKTYPGYSRKECQELRDALFRMHEHPAPQLDE